MKSMKQKTLSLALFGLLAMHSAPSLIGHYEQNREGSISLASTDSTDQLGAMRALLGRETSGDRSQAKFVITNDSYNQKKEAIYRILGISDESAMPKHVVFRSNGDNQEIYILNPRIGELQNTQLQVNGRNLKIKKTELSNQSRDRFGENSEAKIEYKVEVDTEGLYSDCNQCTDLLSELTIPVTLSDIETLDKLKNALTTAITAKVTAADQAKADTIAKKKQQEQKNKARLCLDLPERSQVECMAKRLEDKDLTFSGDLTDEEKATMKDNMAEVIKQRYKKNPQTSEFRKLLTGTKARVFRDIHNEAKREALSELATEERYERERERTQENEEFLQEELARLDERMLEWDMLQREFENTFNYATRDLEQRQWQCDAQAGFMPGRTSSYFGNRFGGNFRTQPLDGFQTWAGNTNTNNLAAWPNNNMMGGNNNFQALQQQTAQMIRNNCLMNVQSVQQYWDWELGNLDQFRIQPLANDLQMSLQRLNVDRLFPTTFRDLEDDNGGLFIDDKRYYQQLIQGYMQDMQRLNSMSSMTGLSTNFNNSLNTVNQWSNSGLQNNQWNNNRLRGQNTTQGALNLGRSRRSRSF